ncbi:hypothetical protein [Paenibacillus sp. BAC0078]
MNVSSIGAHAPQKPIGGGSKNVEQDIKALEQQKAQLEQEKQKEKSPFSLKQSQTYDSIDKKIKDLDKKIQQLRAKASTSEEAPKDQAENQQASSASRQVDEYVSSNGQPRQPSAGTYSVSRNEKGEAVVSFNPSQMDKDASKKNSPDDRSL